MHIIQSFSPYYKLLWSKRERMHAIKQIHCYCYCIGTVKVKVEENIDHLSIRHATDFNNHFRCVDPSIPR